MKIAFRHLPFNEEQRACLDRIAADSGYGTLWCEGAALPESAALPDIEVLMGYFPPAAGVERWCGDIYPNADVVLTNCSGAFGVAISEFMLTGLLMLMRNMPAYMANQRAHSWKGAGNCRAIFGSTITVVGMGDIGRKFAARAKALGARVRGVRRNPGGAVDNFDEIYGASELKRAVSDVDAVVLCLPGTRETASIVSREVIGAMDSRTIVVNCGRGATLDQSALVDALRDGRIAGAVLDVFDAEPLPADNPLWDMANVIVTPHISGHDDDPINAAAIFDIFQNNLRRYLAGQPLAHVVDRSRGY